LNALADWGERLNALVYQIHTLTYTFYNRKVDQQYHKMTR
jgi:hypothetical protein